MVTTRSSGILLPITSLAGLHGIGDLGSGAEEFLDFLSEAGQQVWQVLPLGPAGFGDSPFQSMSAFAGDPLLLSLDHLREEGWLEADELKPLSSLAPGRVDYPTVRSLKFPLLMLAAERFLGGAGGTDRAAFESFCRENEAWLDDFALFSVLRMAQGEQLWTHWDQPIARREPKALAILQARHREGLDQVKFLQFQFFEQWARLRHRAGERGIRIMGDMAIFVSHDSADAWAHPELFFLDDSGNLLFVAGVPPDYFSATGQRWGNPLYRWDRMADQEYSWWVDRMRWTLRSFDLVKIDHFRAFEAYWEIPATETTAQHGRWVRGPGVRLFDTLQRRLGKLPLVVENLGYITAEVEELRLRLGYPGMAVMQFAFGDGADHPFLGAPLRK
ncbi:MAG: 4-alpha-glucanotransferase [Acidobacteria bacterium]|nr:4-alpha-glucanotransferase [Acidobacteriota bacterium]